MRCSRPGAGRDGVVVRGAHDHRAEPVAGAGGEESRRRRRRRGPGRASRTARCRSRGWPRGRRPARSPARGRRSSRARAGSRMRAVTFQSMRRTSSPGGTAGPRPASTPWPGTRPRWSPWSRPSSLRVTMSSRRRSTSEGGSGRRRLGRAVGAITGRAAPAAAGRSDARSRRVAPAPGVGGACGRRRTVLGGATGDAARSRSMRDERRVGVRAWARAS